MIQSYGFSIDKKPSHIKICINDYKYRCNLWISDRSNAKFSFVSFSQLPYLPSIMLGSLQTAVSQAAVGGGGTAADNLELFLSTVGPVQQLLDELLKTQFSIGFTRSCFLQELINLGHLSKWGGNEWKGERNLSELLLENLVIACQFDQCIKEYWVCNSNIWRGFFYYYF